MARVRAFVTEPSGDSRKVVGRVLETSETALTIEKSREAAPQVVLRENITKLELSVRPGRRSVGAMIGLGVGAAAGVALGLAGEDEEETESWDLGPTDEEYAVIGALLLGSVGCLLGMAVAPGEQWEVVNPDAFRLGADSAHQGGRRVLVAIDF
jgi:hypothetical protein